MDQPSWIKPEKLRANMPSRRLLHRSHLSAQMEQNQRQLVLIQAAAGYGKTAFLTQWYTSLASSERPVVWLSLDDEDADPFALLCNIVVALKTAGCNIDYELPHHPSVLSNLASDDVFNAMMNKLSRKSVPEVFFLDNFHLAATDENCRLLRRLMEALNKTTLVVSCRSMPRAFGLAELRSQDRCFEVSKRDLQFDQQEVRAYFEADIEKDELNASLAGILERTEGWPIGLFATRTLVRDGITLDDALSQASGRSAVLSDYFMERVFARLSDSEKNLLLRTSNLSRVNGDLADAVCETDCAWTLLEKLERNEMFVNCFDEDRSWYHYQRLFAEFLAERARRELPGQQSTIYARAAAWYLDNELPNDALEYALKSQDRDLVAETLEEIGGWRQAVTGDMSTVRRALEVISSRDKVSYPRVWLADIYLQLKAGQWSLAKQSYSRLVESYPLTDDLDPAFRSELLIFDGLITVYFDLQDQLPNAIRKLKDLELTTRREDHFLQSTRLNLLCGLHNRTLDFQNALMEGDASILHFRALNALYGEVFLYIHQSYALYETGRLRDAQTTMVQGLDLIEAHYGKGAELYALGAANAGAIEYEWNNLSEAQKYLDYAFPLIEQCDAWIEVYFLAYETDLRIAIAQKEWQRVEAISERALRVSELRQLPRLKRFIETTIADLKLQQEVDLEEVVQSTLDNPTEHDFPLNNLSNVSAFGRMLWTESRFPEAATYFGKWASEFKAKNLVRGFTKLKLLEAISWHSAGELSPATATFETVLSYVRFEGFKRMIIDEGQQAARLIREVSSNNRETGATRLRDRFLAELIADIDANERASESKSVLSEREAEVMRQVLSGRTNRQIGMALSISQNTVKFHLKNIYQKLSVSSRSEAISACLRTDVI